MSKELEDIIAELIIRQTNLEKRFDDFIGVDDRWSKKVAKALTNHETNMERLAYTSNLCNVLLVHVIRRMGLEQKEAMKLFSDAAEMLDEMLANDEDSTRKVFDRTYGLRKGEG